MSIRTENSLRTKLPTTPPATGRISIGLWAQENLKKGRQITELRSGRGQPDLLKSPGALAQFKVGSFEAGKTRGGSLTATVYSVPLPGKDDRLKNHFIVDMPFVRSNDTIGHRFFDLGKGPASKPNV
jgi:hypothetical protein